MKGCAKQKKEGRKVTKNVEYDSSMYLQNMIKEKKKGP